MSSESATAMTTNSIVRSETVRNWPPCQMFFNISST